MPDKPLNDYTPGDIEALSDAELAGLTRAVPPGKESLYDFAARGGDPDVLCGLWAEQEHRATRPPTHELHGAYIVPTKETQAKIDAEEQGRLRVEWQAQIKLRAGWQDYGDCRFHTREGGERFIGERADLRLVRRTWRLESEEVVEL